MEKRYKTQTQKSKRGDPGKPIVYEGTISELVKNVFGYTLEVGASWDRKVNRNPTTIKSLMTNLQRAYEAKEACCFDRTNVTLVS